MAKRDNFVSSLLILAFQNLRDYIQRLQELNLLKLIETDVNPILEICEITDRCCKSSGPALYFKNIQGSTFPVVTNLFGSYERLKVALECQSFDEIALRLKKIFQQTTPKTILEKIKSLSQFREFSEYLPKMVSKAPCQEVVLEGDAIDLMQLPILKCWPEDGGRFITLPLVISKDPSTGISNMGMYRMQVYDERTTGMHWHHTKDGMRHFRKQAESGKALEVAVAIGADPSTILAAISPLPYGIDEFLFAGFLRKKGITLVKCKTLNLEVPAEAEWVLEGHVLPGKTRMEGPFGDHTGFYSLAAPYPVFHVTCLTRRHDAIYPATIVGKPPMEDCFMAKAIERIFIPLIQTVLPEVQDVNLPMEGVFHNCAIVSIKKEYPGQGKKVIHALWGLSQFMHTKIIIVLESDTDIQNLSETTWKVFNNVDPERDLIFSKGPLDDLDHSASLSRFGSKLGIDATRKGREEGMLRDWPDEINMSKEMKEQVNRRWNLYGL